MNNGEKDWLLSHLSINQNYMKKGVYEGNVTFQTGLKMQFAMTLTPEKCQKMIAILKEEIIESAANLGQAMVNSMPVQIAETSSQPEAKS